MKAELARRIQVVGLPADGGFDRRPAPLDERADRRDQHVAGIDESADRSRIADVGNRDLEIAPEITGELGQARRVARRQQGTMAAAVSASTTRRPV